MSYMGSVPRPPFLRELRKWLFLLSRLRSARTLPALELNEELEHKFDLTAETSRRVRAELDSHRTRMIRKVDEYRSLITARLQRLLAVARVERLRHAGLVEMARRELDEIINDAATRRRTETYQTHIYSCPHCGGRLLLKERAANKIVKCPYPGCRCRFKVSLTQ